MFRSGLTQAASAKHARYLPISTSSDSSALSPIPDSHAEEEGSSRNVYKATATASGGVEGGGASGRQWILRPATLAILAAAAALVGLSAASSRSSPAPSTASSSHFEEAIRKAAMMNIPPGWGPQLKCFYMYRAQNSTDAPLENVNAANLAGVMWQLHNEVISADGPFRTDRITRIVQYRVCTRPTWEYWNLHQRHFASFLSFVDGTCTAPSCPKLWRHHGFMVGCQAKSPLLANYLSDTETLPSTACGSSQCRPPLWYSLPGGCPHRDFWTKDPFCTSTYPGGRCEEVNGAMNCTYSAEQVGEVLLSELVPETEDYTDFVANGLKEYDHLTDKGVGVSFWDGRKNPERCAQRLEAVKALFNRKFPDAPALSDPVCDFDRYTLEEFQRPPDHMPKLPGVSGSKI